MFFWFYFLAYFNKIWDSWGMAPKPNMIHAIWSKDKTNWVTINPTRMITWLYTLEKNQSWQISFKLCQRLLMPNQSSDLPPQMLHFSCAWKDTAKWNCGSLYYHAVQSHNLVMTYLFFSIKHSSDHNHNHHHLPYSFTPSITTINVKDRILDLICAQELELSHFVRQLWLHLHQLEAHFHSLTSNIYTHITAW